ncbi:patatin-like phospholipase family protein [Rhodanobacter aciditrophus]|uniref:patatin-like phospholipase family protein n=1 Tax=Rhodanobacter aciditrophus TaxID=1623218 RepID=UPI003CF51BCA
MVRIAHASALCAAFGVLCGCASAPRLPPPPELAPRAAPAGFPPDIRLLTIDRATYNRRMPVVFGRLAQAADDGSIDYLVLSGGGSGGAFGAGALVGLTQVRQRPQFEVVTGVSAGALLAPFAFLGPEWDPELKAAFDGNPRLDLMHGKLRTVIARLFFPGGATRHSALQRLVDHYVTDAMLQAVAAGWRKGRLLFVATTDLDKRETVLWNMGEIAAQGGKPALKLFREVLVASASVPGIFPPVLIQVREDGRDYDEMHVDGSITTSLFAAPHVAQLLPAGKAGRLPVNLYVIVNGKLAQKPLETPLNTIDVLSRSFDADLTYKMRESLLLAMDYAHRQHMRFRLTEIPPAYPKAGFVDFSPEHMHALFDFGARCAERGELWETPEDSIRHNLARAAESGALAESCPAAP